MGSIADFQVCASAMERIVVQLFSVTSRPPRAACWNFNFICWLANETSLIADLEAPSCVALHCPHCALLEGLRMFTKAVRVSTLVAATKQAQIDCRSYASPGRPTDWYSEVAGTYCKGRQKGVET